MRRATIGCVVLCLCGLAPGCRHAQFREVIPALPPSSTEIQKVGHQSLAPETLPQAPGNAAAALPRLTAECETLLFAGATELALDALLQAVQDRNPSLAEMTAAWQAALARYPQVTALDDPMWNSAIGPATFGSPNVDFAFDIQLAQKIPFPGKRQLRGDAANAEAQAAGHEVDDMRLQLTESARSAFYDYYLAERALEVNARALQLLKELQSSIRSRYRTGQIAQHDVLQAELEVGRQEEQELAFRRARQVAVARINTLLHQPPDTPLPPPPAAIKLTDSLPDAAALRSVAVSRRPDLQALAARVAAEEARVALARKDYYPDFTPWAEYNKFMGNRPPVLPLAYFLGLNLNLPVYRNRLDAAVAEALARLAQRKAELARLCDQVNYQVEEGYARVQESAKTVRLYEEKVLRSAEQNVSAAQAAYITAQIPFVSLLQAERDLVALQNRYHQAVADYYSRRAALERAAGGPL